MRSIVFSSSSLIHSSTSSNLLLNPSGIFFSSVVTSVWYFLKFSLYWSSHCVCLFFSSVQQAFLWLLLWNLHQVDCLSPFCLVLSQLVFFFFFFGPKNLWKRTKWSADVPSVHPPVLAGPWLLCGMLVGRAGPWNGCRAQSWQLLGTRGWDYCSTSSEAQLRCRGGQGYWWCVPTGANRLDGDFQNGSAVLAR